MYRGTQSLSILVVLVFETLELTLALSITQSSFHVSDSLYAWIQENSTALVAMTVYLSLGLVVIPLCAFHSFLMCGNLTTYEVGKGPDKLGYLRGTKECDLPFSTGLLGNLSGFCCVRDGAWTLLGMRWKPQKWKPIGYVVVQNQTAYEMTLYRRIERNSTNVCENLWENKYYSCC